MAENVQLIVDILTRGGAAAATAMNTTFRTATESTESFTRSVNNSGLRFDAALGRWRDSSGKFVRVFSADMEKSRQAAKSAVANIGNLISGLGQTFQTVGLTLSASLTAPLAALAALSNKSAISMDDLRNKLISATGSVENANAKLEKFKSLSADSAGVLVSFAAETYAFLKPMQLGETTITNFTKALGRIKLTDSGLDTKEFSLNLSQLFKQNFEIADLKQLIGRFPRAAELIAKQFGLDGSDLDTLQQGLQKMRKAGKLTFEGFLSGFAEAVENDSALSKLNDTLGTRLAKGFERLNLSLAPLGAAILDVVIPALETIAPYVENLFKWFGSLSEPIKNIIIGFGVFAAALGPVLLALGAFIGFIAPLVSGIGSLVLSIAAAGSFTAFLTGALASAGAVLTVVIIPALKILIPAALAVGVALAAVGAAAVALYAVWTTNFGNLRTYTLQVWEVIKNTVAAAMDFIQNTVETIGGAVVKWWEENYPQIERTVNRVSEAIKSTISSFLAVVESFWQSHGSRIRNYISTVWGVIKDVTSLFITQIGNIFSLGLAVINGDWEKAWSITLRITRDGSLLLTRIWKGFTETIASIITALIPIFAQISAQFALKAGEWSTKITAAVIVTLAKLPGKIIEMVPKFLKAGLDIGSAIFQGIKDGLKGTENITPQPPTQNQNQTGGSASDKSASGSLSGGSEIISAKEADKRRKEREEIAKRDIAAQVQLLRSQLDAIEKEYDEKLKRLREIFKETGDVDTFTEGFRAANIAFLNESNETREKLEAAQNKQADTEKKIASERKVILQEQTELRKKIVDKMLAETAENEKLATEAQKKSTEKRIRNDLAALEFQLEQTERSYQAQQAYLDAQHAEGLISEEAYQRARQKLILDYTSATERDGRLVQIETSKSLLNYKLSNLNEQLQAAAGNAEKENEIKRKISEVNSEIEVEYFNQQKQNAEFRKKSLDDQKKLELELIELKKQLVAEEARLEEFRAEQERKRLENRVEAARGKERIKALETLRDFEIAETERQKRVREEELEAEKNAALKKIEGKKNEEEQKFQIEQLYKEKSLLSEEEFQARLKEIRDNFRQAVSGAVSTSGVSQAGSAVADSVGGLFGDLSPENMELYGAIADSLTQTFGALAGAVGNAVEAFVKFGSAGGSFRKFAAEMLASIAKMAAIQAIWNLAEGFAKLALAFFGHPTAGASATQHFIAAAVYGSIAGVAAIAGRAVAGNSFKQQSSAATGGGSGAQSSGANRRTGSDEEGRAIEQGRNSPFGGNAARPKSEKLEITLRIQSNDSHIVQTIDENINRPGRLRDSFITLVEHS